MARKSLRDDVAADVSNSQQLAVDAELARLRSELATCRNRYKVALAQIDRERERGDALVQLHGIKPVPSLPKSVKGPKHAATMVVLLSDVHCEERVDPETVNGLNDYSLDVCQLRLNELHERFFRLLEHERQLAKIDRVVIWLGGDFLSGHIHDDTAELAQLARWRLPAGSVKGYGLSSTPLPIVQRLS